jgi:hypothetical protein
LEEDGNETILTYKATAQVGGKLAQIGSRLIDSTAKKMAGQFFGKFAEEVGETPEAAVEAPAAESSPVETPAAAAESSQDSGGISPMVWIAGLVAVVVVVLVILN